jgi:hypothetical protein
MGLRDCRPAGGTALLDSTSAPPEQPMSPMERLPFVPTEIHVGTVKDKSGTLGILSIQTTEGRLDFTLDREAAEAIVKATNAIRLQLEPNKG